MTEENIRFVNVMVDMLIPQRATLFGWAILFTALCTLYQGIHTRRKSYFVLTGIFAGALPMIHTHSLLVLALVSAMWLITDIANHLQIKRFYNLVKFSFFFLPFAMTFLQFILAGVKTQSWLWGVPLGVFLIFLLPVLRCFKKEQRHMIGKIISPWLIFLGITLLLALPQLFYWTFQQAKGEQFVRPHFNWANSGDNYLLFYLKNLGLTAVFYLPAVLMRDKNILQWASPIILIMSVSECVLFQPNPYDNNKLIFVAYLFLCGMTANFFVKLLAACKKRGYKILLSTAGLFLFTASAILTMGREIVSDYVLFGSNYVSLADFVTEHTPKNAVFLTGDRHNNEVAALTGRNIVCGAGTYLYYHGLNYEERKQEVKIMYENPSYAQEFFEKYQVSYILITKYEKDSYQIDMAYYQANSLTVYENEEVALLQLNPLGEN